MARLLIIGVVLGAVAAMSGCHKATKPGAPTSRKASSPSSEPASSIIRGRIVDPAGRGIGGVNVHLWYLRAADDFPFDGDGTFTTDADGRYEISTGPNVTHWAVVDGKESTYAESKRFRLKAGERYEVENLIVRPASASCRGRLVFEDGSPAANIPYGYFSKNFSPVDAHDPPRTDARGEFVIERLLPDEPFQVWALPAENTLWFQRSLSPDSGPLQLTLKKDQYVTLPEDWRPVSTHLGVAAPAGTVPSGKIQFALKDLAGNVVSLTDDRFRGKAVIVNISASWCGGCMAELPYLIELQDRYGPKGLQIVSIMFEDGTAAQQIEAVRRVSMRFKKLNFPMLIGHGSHRPGVVEVDIKGLEGFSGYPTNIYIDRGGTVRLVECGFYVSSEAHEEWQRARIDRHISSLLESDEPGK